MELWVEYFLRHKMPLVCPFDPFLEMNELQIVVRANPPEEHRLWSQFIESNTDIVQTVECGDLLVIWGEEIAQCRLGWLPTLTEQQTLLFSQVPELESAWDVFNRRPIRRSSFDLGSVRDFHRRWSVRDHSRPVSRLDGLPGSERP